MAKQMRFYVYIHLRKDNGKVFYVGSAGEVFTNNPSKGFNRARSGESARRSQYWHDMVDEAGGFDWQITDECSTDFECRQKELERISQYGLTNLVNVRKQAIGWGEGKRKRQARYGKDHPNFGKKLSEETRRKKSEALQGDKHHLYGKQLPQEWKDNIARTKTGKQNPMWGKTGARHPRSKQVKNTETGMVYVSLVDAARKEGYDFKQLSSWLLGTRKNPTCLEYV